MAENGSGEQLQQEEKDGNERSRQSDRSSFTTSTQRQQIQDREDEEKRPERRRSAERRTEISPRSEEWHDDSKRRLQEIKPLMENKMKEERKEVKVSYTSQVFLQKDRVPNGNGEAAAEEMTSHLVKTKRSPSRTVDVDQIFETKKDVHAGLETELKLEKIRRSHQEKESKEMEQLRQRQAEAELELEELKKKREERRKAREEEERKKEEEEQQKLTKKEEEKRQMKEDIERRRIEAAEKRMKNATDGDDPFNPLNPMSPTFKITARTESLNQSLKKSNSFKKTQRPVLLPKIDDKLEQYTNAIEISSKDAKLTKSATVDMPSVSAPVASKKNLFEAGEVRSQSSPKGTPLKDTECVKVGVANLINHWVKGSPEGGNRQSPSTPSDVKPGDVLQKKNMWEIIGEGSAGERSGLGGKGSSSGKRYKFVVTGHGKYEKISTDGDHYSVYPNGKTSEFSSDRL
ncbi:caldesmon, smooth muscle-like isoform X5 [Carassius gibelio]|nr:caldesmon, smooth muscle-like isoform X5 [Carassius gibelio]